MIFLRCQLSQHYANENIDVSLRFMFSGQAGVVSINGRARSDSQNILTVKYRLACAGIRISII